MAGIDERLREGLRGLAEVRPPQDPGAVLERVAGRRRRRQVMHRAQVAALVLVVVAGSAGTVVGLMHAFRGRPAPAPAATPPASSTRVTVSNVRLYGDNQTASTSMPRIEKVYGVLTNHAQGWSQAFATCVLRDAGGQVVWGGPRSGPFLLGPGVHKQFFLASGEYTGPGASSASCSVTATPAPAPAPTPRPTFPPGEAVAPGFQPTSIAFWNANDGLIAGGVAKHVVLHGTCSGPCRGIIAVTHDGGRTWRIAEWTPQAVDEVVVAPGTSDAWLVLRSAAGRPDGILHTTDGGRTWTSLPGGVTGLSFPTATDGWGVPAAPAQPGSAMLAHTTDGGATWARIPAPCPKAAWTPTAVSFATPATGLLVCTGEPGAGQQSKAILSTTDGGASWRVEAEAAGYGGPGRPAAPPHGLSTNGYLNGVGVLASGDGWAWGDRSPIVGTADFGGRWRVVSSSISNGATGGPLGVSMLSATHELVLAFSRPNQSPSSFDLLSTTDGGRTWSVVQAWPESP